MDPTTRLLHAIEAPDAGRPAEPDLTLASYLVSDGEPDAADYLRADHPNWRDVERVLGALENADAVLFPSGQAATHAVLADLARTAGRLVLPEDGYYNTWALAAVVADATGVDVATVDLLDLDAVGRALDGGPAALWVETPTNPLLRVADLAALAAVVASSGAPMVVDNTLATALRQQPLAFGASASVASLTKGTTGHSDVLAGAVVTADVDLADRLRAWRTVTGAVPGAFEAWLVARSLRTLAVRSARQCATALTLARHLHADGRVAVHYPGLPPHREVADRQMTGGYGSVLSFEVDGDAAAADAVVAAARLIRPGTSFGGVVSSWERRARWPAETAPQSLIRLSVGLEAAGDLLTDLDQSLAAGVR